MLKSGLFITGTDTGVGKTVVTSHLGAFLQSKGYDVGVMKPTQTGLSDERGDYHEYRKWMKIDEEKLVVPVSLQAPQAPSIAAKLENKSVRFDAIRRSLYILSARHKNMLIEGAGGVAVPVCGKKTMIDIMKLADLPVLVVARSTLGTINHTLLTVEHLRRNCLSVAGIVFNPVADDSNGVFQMVKSEIVKLSGVKLCVEMGVVGRGVSHSFGGLLKFFRK